MTKHMFDAILLNTNRMFKYSKLTSYKSFKFSLLLIIFEFLALFPAIYFDFKSRKYLKNGINIIKDDFIEINQTPSFNDNFDFNIENYKYFEKYDIKELINNLYKCLIENNFIQISSFSIICLRELEAYKIYYNLTRHTILSINRISKFAEIHNTKSLELNLSPTILISKKLISLHLKALKIGYYIDIKSYKINQKGIPFLYNDMPIIPLSID